MSPQTANLGKASRSKLGSFTSRKISVLRRLLETSRPPHHAGKLLSSIVKSFRPETQGMHRPWMFEARVVGKTWPFLQSSVVLALRTVQDCYSQTETLVHSCDKSRAVVTHSAADKYCRLRESNRWRCLLQEFVVRSLDENMLTDEVRNELFLCMTSMISSISSLIHPVIWSQLMANDGRNVENLICPISSRDCNSGFLSTPATHSRYGRKAW